MAPTKTAELAWATVATPVGPVSAACSAAGVTRIRFGPPPAGAAVSGPPPGGAAEAPAPVAAPVAAQAEAARTALAEYFAGQRRVFGLTVDWPEMSDTRRSVLTVLLETVGFGQTVTYGQLAERSGLVPGGQTPPARVVGQVMAANPLPLLVPCHRVLSGTGLGGFSGGIGVELKRWLLTFEGALPPTLDWDPAGLPG